MGLSNRTRRRDDTKVLPNLQTYIVRVNSTKRVYLRKPAERIY